MMDSIRIHRIAEAIFSGYDNVPGRDGFIVTNIGGLTMKSMPIKATTRKLKAVWTVELAEDLQSMHGIS